MENKKCLYWQRHYQIINGDKCHICSILKYGIMPQDQKWEYKTFDEFWQNRCDFSCYSHKCKKLFGKEEVRKIYYSTNRGYKNKRLKEKDFKSACLEIKYEENAINYYSIKQISEYLTADMFFDYCKDHMITNEVL